MTAEQNEALPSAAAYEAPVECPVPMWPGGPECFSRAGHYGPHKGLSDNITWTFTACWNKTIIDGQEYVCIREKGHSGGHANG